MKCCRACGSLCTVGGQSHSTNPNVTPPQHRWNNHTYSSVGKYVPQRCLLPTSTLINHTQSWHKVLPSGKHVHPRGIPFLISPQSSAYFGTIFSCQNLGTKLVIITFPLRHEEVFLVLTLQKHVWKYYHYYLQFSFAMWIIHIINIDLYLRLPYMLGHSCL